MSLLFKKQSKIEAWSPDSWRQKPVQQQPTYKDSDALARVRERLKIMPPLIFPQEAVHLKEKLAQVGRGEAFLLMGGDCAESFDAFSEQNLRNLYQVMLMMTVVFLYAGKKPLIKIARSAGQFAKPRSADTETIDGKTLPAYRGDLVNGIEFSEEAREPDPQRLIHAYFQSAATLNFMRSLSQGGYATLEKAHEWVLDFTTKSACADEYQVLVDKIKESLEFMQACGLDTHDGPRQLTQTKFYTAHEALLLDYEEPFVRFYGKGNAPYATTSHFVWVGNRTRDLDGGHIEFLRGIQNPVGMKCGPGMSGDELCAILDKINPSNEEGKVTLISRFGVDEIKKGLPSLIRAVKKSGQNVLWVVDPMHGNTKKTNNNIKTRYFQDVHAEIMSFFDICEAEGVYASGIHLEMTGNNVTECVGGMDNVSEQNLHISYDTLCDPRLNANQATEIAFEVARRMAKSSAPKS